MEQVAFRFLGIDFYWYGVFLAAAFIAGLANATWVGKRTGRQFPLFSDLLFWVVIGGIAGARLAYVAANWEEFAREPLKMANLRSGGLVFYGGLAGAAAAFLLFVRRRREGFWSLGDVAVTSLPLGHALGRIGCFMQGCCHGTTTASSFGVLYPPGSPVWHNQVRAGLIEASSESCLRVHPVQIYEAVANIAIWGALILFYRRPHRDGQIVGLYAMLYGVTRFSVEALRGDERLRFLGGLSLAQAASVAVFIAGISAWILAGRRADRTPQPKGG